MARSTGYDVEAVDWILDQLRRREDHGDLAGAGADPWRGLAMAKYFSRSEPGLAQECAAAWRDFSEVPGRQLRWVWAGAARRELRTAEQQTIASRHGQSATFGTGRRTFTRTQVTGSSWPDIAEIVRRSRLESSNRHFFGASTVQVK